MLTKLFIFLFLSVEPEDMHPSLASLNMLTQSNVLRENNPFLQEIELYAETFGGYSTDLVRGRTSIHQRYPGLVYLQERMKEAVSGQAAYSIYLGKHGVLRQESLHLWDRFRVCRQWRMFFIVAFHHLPGLKVY